MVLASLLYLCHQLRLTAWAWWKILYRKFFLGSATNRVWRDEAFSIFRVQWHIFQTSNKPENSMVFNMYVWKFKFMRRKETICYRAYKDTKPQLSIIFYEVVSRYLDSQTCVSRRETIDRKNKPREASSSVQSRIFPVSVMLNNLSTRTLDHATYLSTYCNEFNLNKETDILFLAPFLTNETMYIMWEKIYFPSSLCHHWFFAVLRRFTSSISRKMQTWWFYFWFLQLQKSEPKPQLQLHCVSKIQ